MPFDQKPAGAPDLDDLAEKAGQVVARARAAKLMIATAESCTAGLIAAAITEVAGSSAVFDRGFVTYSNEAKTELLGVPWDLILREGAVSPDVAKRMAVGALERSRADIAVAVTGVAGPGGGSPEKPVGTVHFGLARTGAPVEHVHVRFPDAGRRTIRFQTVLEALELITKHLPVSTGG
ncbi:competence damage-inducible protein A [Roseibium aquae]|uniref:Competence damage-inducible protein A n=1 Tax=Roseibium aquae TaxID=1323746 RepID=A0A916TI44_9HYPH|nr:CinA family protein [Roseibium aquae]GGB44985.1 competence damage-inducible protein A [Roseibium aquae]